MRYNQIEQLGINAVQRIVTEEMRWIFRPVPPPDLGIDAHMEQVIDDVPSAKLVAIQIKSGLGNFHVGEKKITRYVSLVHYHYWLSSNIPVILVAHINEWNKTIWEVIDESTLKKTPSQWKIELSRFKELNANSIPILNKIIEQKQSTTKELKPAKSNESLALDSERVLETTASISAIIGFLNDVNTYSKEHLEYIESLPNSGLTISSPVVKSKYTLYGTRLFHSAILIEEEIERYAESFAASIAAVAEIVKRHHDATKETSQLKIAYDMLIMNPPEMKRAIKTVKELKSAFRKYQDMGNSSLKMGKAKFENSLDAIAREYGVALGLMETVISNIEVILDPT